MDIPPPERIYTLTELGVFVGVVTTSITGAVVAIITAWRTGAKVDKVGAQVAEVHELTNSSDTRQKNEIVLLLNKVNELTAHIAEQEKVRAVLAAEVKVPLLVPLLPPHVEHATLPAEEPPRIITP